MSDPTTEHSSTDDVAQRTPWAVYAGVFALCLAHVLMNVWFLARDNHTVRTDEATHMMVARDYWYVLDFLEFPNAIERAIAAVKVEAPVGNPIHPPLLHVLGAAMNSAFGYNMDSMALANTLSLAILILGSFLLARTFMGPMGALFAALIVSLTPGIYVGSRVFMTDHLSAAIVVWAVLTLVYSRHYLHTGWVFAFAILNGLAILARTPSFLYLLGPSALVAAAGLWHILRKPEHEGLRANLFGWWLLHGVLTVVVTLGVIAPWYVPNLERMYNYWTKEHQAQGPLTVEAAPAKPEAQAPEESAAEAPRTEAEPTAAPPKPEKTVVKLERRTPWARYFVHITNNVAFLPLVLLGIAGCIAVPLLGRYRRFPAVLCVVWIVSSYVALTLLIKFSNPRYALQFMPALSLMAAAVVWALPWARVRWAAVGGLVVYLLVAYINLSIVSFGGWGNWYAPFPVDKSEQRKFQDDGLAWMKNSLSFGFSYAGLSAPVPENSSVRLFKAMVEYENRKTYATGSTVGYISLNKRGLQLYEPHFWPEPNPFYNGDIPRESLPQRRFQLVAYGQRLSHIRNAVNDASYVVYGISATGTPAEERWDAFLTKQGFERIEHFLEPRQGPYGAQHFAVYARKPAATQTISSVEDIEELDLIRLYELRQHAAFPTLPTNVQQVANERFATMLDAVSTPQTISEYVTFVAAQLARQKAGTYKLNLFFKLYKPLDRNWRIFLHGYPDAEDRNKIPPQFREQGFVDWNFDPSPPVLAWRPGEITLVSRTISVQPIPYLFRLGFFQGDYRHGLQITLGKIDFEALEAQ